MTATSGKSLPFERSFPPHERQYTITGLSCGSRLELSMKAFNSIGFGDDSVPLIAKTTGAGTYPHAPLSLQQLLAADLPSFLAPMLPPRAPTAVTLFT